MVVNVSQTQSENIEGVKDTASNEKGGPVNTQEDMFPECDNAIESS